MNADDMVSTRFFICRINRWVRQVEEDEVNLNVQKQRVSFHKLFVSQTTKNNEKIYQAFFSSDFFHDLLYSNVAFVLL